MAMSVEDETVEKSAVDEASMSACSELPGLGNSGVDDMQSSPNTASSSHGEQLFDVSDEQDGSSLDVPQADEPFAAVPCGQHENLDEDINRSDESAVNIPILHHLESVPAAEDDADDTVGPVSTERPAPCESEGGVMRNVPSEITTNAQYSRGEQAVNLADNPSVSTFPDVCDNLTGSSCSQHEIGNLGTSAEDSTCVNMPKSDLPAVDEVVHAANDGADQDRLPTKLHGPWEKHTSVKEVDSANNQPGDSLPETGDGVTRDICRQDANMDLGAEDTTALTGVTCPEIQGPPNTHSGFVIGVQPNQAQEAEASSIDESEEAEMVPPTEDSDTSLKSPVFEMATDAELFPPFNEAGEIPEENCKQTDCPTPASTSDIESVNEGGSSDIPRCTEIVQSTTKDQLPDDEVCNHLAAPLKADAADEFPAPVTPENVASTGTEETAPSEDGEKSRQVIPGNLMDVIRMCKLKLEPNDTSQCGADAGGESSSQDSFRDGSQEMPGAPDNPVSDDIVDAQMAGTKCLIHQLQQVLKTSDAKSQTPAQWIKEINKLEQRSLLPGTTIAFVGNTGDGKSSLMNALLDHADILPTSCVRACTSVVVEVTANKEDRVYKAEIEFLSKEEWVAELSTLLEELTREGRVRVRQPDPSSAAGVAWNKIRAVYGPFKDDVTVKSLVGRKNVTNVLGRNRMIASDTAKKFRKQIDRYIESNDSGTGGDLWPIVKKVSLKIPNCDVLSSGVTLIDLPGTGDSNSARDKIAKDFLKSSTAVWVVAAINRAMNNKQAKELLDEHFRRQLVMDGQYTSVSFICTKTDQLTPSEMIRKTEIGLGPMISTMNNNMNDLDARKETTETLLETLSVEISKLEKQLSAKNAELAVMADGVAALTAIIASHNDAEVSQDPGEEPPTDMLTTMKQAYEKQSSEVASAEEEREHKCREMEQAKENLSNVEEEISQARKELTKQCAQARNDFARKAIIKDFKAGYRDLKRKALHEDDDDDDDDEDECTDEETEDDEADDIIRSANSLKVFCVSSTDYLKLTGKLTKSDGPASVFTSEGETGIPQLKACVHEVTRCRRKNSADGLLRGVGKLSAEIVTYLVDKGTENTSSRDQAKYYFLKNIKTLQIDKIRNVIGNFESDVEDCVTRLFEPRLEDGVKKAVRMAEPTCEKWGSKQNRSNPKDGGLHIATYNATCRNDGVYKSPAAGEVNFNRDLTVPVYASITIVWSEIFNRRLPDMLSTFVNNVIDLVEKFCVSLTTHLKKIVANDRMTRIRNHVVSNSRFKLVSAIDELKNYITEEQKEINRIITPAVQVEMTSVYQLCVGEKGKGCFARMKVHMNERVSSLKNQMFTKAAQLLVQKLQIFQQEIIHRLIESSGSLLEEITRLYEPLWDTGLKAKTLRSVLMPGMRDLFLDLEGHYGSCEMDLQSPEIVSLRDVLEAASSDGDDKPCPAAPPGGMQYSCPPRIKQEPIDAAENDPCSGLGDFSGIFRGRGDSPSTSQHGARCEPGRSFPTQTVEWGLVQVKQEPDCSTVAIDRAVPAIGTAYPISSQLARNKVPAATKVPHSSAASSSGGVFKKLSMKKRKKSSPDRSGRTSQAVEKMFTDSSDSDDTDYNPNFNRKKTKYNM